MKTWRELNNSPENSSPGAFGGFGAGSSSSKFDFFNSAGGMFGGGTGSTQEETGNGSGGKYNFYCFESLPQKRWFQRPLFSFQLTKIIKPEVVSLHSISLDWILSVSLLGVTIWVVLALISKFQKKIVLPTKIGRDQCEISYCNLIAKFKICKNFLSFS